MRFENFAVLTGIYLHWTKHYAAKINDEVVKKGNVIGHGDKHPRISSVLHIRETTAS